MRHFCAFLWVLVGGIAGLNASNSSRDSLLNLLQTQAQDTQRVKTLMEIADLYMGSSLKDAATYSLEAYNLAGDLDWTTGKLQSTVQLGMIHGRMGDQTLSLKYHFEHVEIAEKAKNFKALGFGYNNIGVSYLEANDLESALKYFNRSKDIFIKNGHNKSSIYPIHNIGTLHLKNEELDEAMEAFQQNLATLKEAPSERVEAVTLNNIGRVHFLRKQYPEALESYEKALEIKLNMGNIGGAQSTLQNIAKVLAATGKTEEAEKMLLESVRVSDSLGFGNYLADAWEELAEFYRGQQQYELAFEALEMKYETEDSLEKKENHEQLENLRNSIEFKDKEFQISALEIENKLQTAKNDRQRLIIFFGAIGLGIIVVFLFLLLRMNRVIKRSHTDLEKKNQLIQNQQDEILHQNETLSRQNKDLENLNREKDGLIGIVAHDLKSPLNNSLAMVSMIEKQGELSPTQQKCLEMIRKVCNQGQSLIQDLLELNVIENSTQAPKIAQTDIKDLLAHQIEIFRPAAEVKQIQLTIDMPEPNLAIQTSQDYLNRVLQNLISNAIKFSPIGKDILLSAHREDTRICIKVKDHGPGFSEEDKQKMFRNFQKLTARPTGGESSTGLGLAIVKSLVSRLKGEIRLESTLGEGATFEIWLPTHA